MFLLNGLAFGTDPITYKYFLNELSNLFGGQFAEGVEDQAEIFDTNLQCC